QPVIGASVLVKGTQIGTITGVDGDFTLPNVPSSAKTLQISFIGMKTQEVAIKPNMRVLMKPESELLEEVMVVAYGTAKKSSFTGAASTIDGKQLETRPVTNVTKSLEGQSTGVITTSGSGQPGSGASVVIRGYGSINASQTPLYVVDGVPFDGNISSINPSDIESMTILKDASASALYGARGANGVVVVTTKRGKEGKASVSWRSSVGWSYRALKPYDMVGQKDFVQLTFEALKNSYTYNNGKEPAEATQLAINDIGELLGGNENAELYNPFKNYTWKTLIDPTTGQVKADAISAYDDKWMDAVQREGALRHEHQFSLNGGTDKLKYMFSLGYLNEDGILKQTSFERYNARVNVESQITSWFKAGLNTALSNSTQNFLDYDGTSTSNVWYSAQFIAPIYPTYLRDDKGALVTGANGEPTLDYGENGRPKNPDFNPLGSFLDDKAFSVADNASIRTNMIIGSDEDNAGWLKGLKLLMTFGADYRAVNSTSYMNMLHGNQKGSGLLYKTSSRMQSYTFNQLLNWKRSFGKHNIDLLGGHEFYAYNYQYLEGAKANLISGILELRPGATLKSADSYTNNYRIDSWLGRLNYDYEGRYYLSASLRTDGSSRFHKDNRWGSFWSLGATWRVSEEAWLKDVEWLKNLSLRMSYGEQGNDALSTLYAWQSLYSLDYPNANQAGAMIASLETKDVSWEKSGNFNVGVEASLFDGRLNASIEYFNRKTSDMLLSYPKATSTGFDGYNANVGDMRNHGWEASIDGTLIDVRNFRWNMKVMGSAVKNKVLKLTAESPQIISGIYIIKEGMPLRTFYMAKSAGVDPATGAQLYYAYEKMNDDGSIEGEYITSDYSKAANSKYYQGSRIPDLYGSISSEWKLFDGFDVSVLATYSIGGKVYDGLYAGSMNAMYAGDTWNKHALRRWQKPGDITDVPRMEIGGKYTTTNRFLVNASYLSIKNVTVGYTFPSAWLKKVGFQSARIYGSVDNLALFSYLDGMDPQYNFTGGTDYSYTPNKTYSIGVEFKF
uniref:SusC/RagA family TonB-linked outer membrane protein n=1 Tax=Prevotella heparinolytica TaxID=28113 RepID=UPI0035A06622